MCTLGLGHVPRVVTSATWHQGPASFRPCALPSSALTVVCMLASHGPEIAAAASELTSACRPGKKGWGGSSEGSQVFPKTLSLHSLDGAVSPAFSEM